MNQGVKIYNQLDRKINLLVGIKRQKTTTTQKHKKPVYLQRK